VISQPSKPCPFCEIVCREDPDVREIYRDPNVVAFFPIEPATLGHTLVVPRRHISDIWGMDEAEASQVAIATMRIATAVRSALAPDGLNIIQSNGEAATQTVFHLHVHVVPRWTEDNLGRIWPPETNYSDREKDWALERVREELRKDK